MEMKLEVKGDVLITHCGNLANPFDPYFKQIQALNKKKGKTIDDIIDLSRIEWEGGLYLHNGIISIPGRTFESTILNAAKMDKLGKLFSQAFQVTDAFIDLVYPNPQIKVDPVKVEPRDKREIPNPILQKFYEKFADRVVIKGHVSTRSIFHDWKAIVNVMFDENMIGEKILKQVIEKAGKYIGWCVRKPDKTGRFDVKYIS